MDKQMSQMRETEKKMQGQMDSISVLEIVASVFKHALDILARNRQALERGAALLLARDTLTEAELREIGATLDAPLSPAGERPAP